MAAPGRGSMVHRKRVGIVDVARILGLSTYTVSRALNGHADVNAGTRERVLAAAQQLGYTANALGQKLRRDRTDAIGLLLTPSLGNFIDSYFVPVLAGVDTVLSRAGYAILVAGATPDLQEMDVLRRLVEGRRTDAVILTRVRIGDPRAAYLRRLGFPFAMLGRDSDAPLSPYVDVDHRTTARMATHWLIERGHRRIALINTPRSVHASAQLLAGWIDAHNDVGLPIEPAFIQESNYTSEGGSGVADALLELRPRPTAILCGTDTMALGTADAARARGLAVGVDLSIIGCDDIPQAAFTTPALTTFRTSLPIFGETLAQQVLALLRGELPESKLIVPEWVERDSAGPVPGN